MLAVITSEIRMLAAITSEFRMLAMITGEFRKLGVINGEFRKLAVITDEFRKLGAITGEFRRLGIMTGEFRKLALLSLHMRSDSYYTCVLKDLLLIWPIVCVQSLSDSISWNLTWIKETNDDCKMWLLTTLDFKVFRYFLKFP